nr:epidermal growth factor-like protein 6 [Pocillopora verrucosa]
MALKGFAFKRMAVAAPHICDILCEREIICQIYNFNRKEQIKGSQNNRTKDARPENFRSDPAWFYIRRLNGRDHDECISGNNACDVNAYCTNTVGSYYCTCKEGYTGDGRSCSDIDECLSGKHSCEGNTTCNNTIGSYSCRCKKGYQGNKTNCTDIDECLKRTHGCDVNAVCNNFLGSYKCTCKDGFQGYGTKCTDN